MVFRFASHTDVSALLDRKWREVKNLFNLLEDSNAEETGEGAGERGA